MQNELHFMNGQRNAARETNNKYTPNIQFNNVHDL